MRSAAASLASAALLLLLLSPAAVEGFFATRILRHSHSSHSHSSVVDRRAPRATTGPPAIAASPSSSSPTRLASQRASSDGFGDARGRSAFMDQGRIELLCKAGPDGASLGDCPFCHYVQMVLRYKVGWGLRLRLRVAGHRRRSTHTLPCIESAHSTNTPCATLGPDVPAGAADAGGQAGVAPGGVRRQDALPRARRGGACVG